MDDALAPGDVEPRVGHKAFHDIDKDGIQNERPADYALECSRIVPALPTSFASPGAAADASAWLSFELFSTGPLVNHRSVGAFLDEPFRYPGSTHPMIDQRYSTAARTLIQLFRVSFSRLRHCET